jgi:hypothetical protein
MNAIGALHATPAEVRAFKLIVLDQVSAPLPDVFPVAYPTKVIRPSNLHDLGQIMSWNWSPETTLGL